MEIAPEVRAVAAEFAARACAVIAQDRRTNWRHLGLIEWSTGRVKRDAFAGKDFTGPTQRRQHDGSIGNFVQYIEVHILNDWRGFSHGSARCLRRKFAPLA